MDLMTNGGSDTGTLSGKDDAVEKASSERSSSSNEVTKAHRRRFSAAYKERIVKQAEACSKPGELGALLRREGLYSSHLGKWRQQFAEGTVAGLGPKKRGPKANPDKKLIRENEKLRREAVRLKKKLERAELNIDYQKKVSEILGITLDSQQDDSNDENN